MHILIIYVFQSEDIVYLSIASGTAFSFLLNDNDLAPSTAVLTSVARVTTPRVVAVLDCPSFPVASSSLQFGGALQVFFCTRDFSSDIRTRPASSGTRIHVSKTTLRPTIARVVPSVGYDSLLVSIVRSSSIAISVAAIAAAAALVAAPASVRSVRSSGRPAARRRGTGRGGRGVATVVTARTLDYGGRGFDDLGFVALDDAGGDDDVVFDFAFDFDEAHFSLIFFPLYPSLTSILSFFYFIMICSNGSFFLGNNNGVMAQKREKGEYCKK